MENRDGWSTDIIKGGWAEWYRNKSRMVREKKEVERESKKITLHLFFDLITARLPAYEVAPAILLRLELELMFITFLSPSRPLWQPLSHSHLLSDGAVDFSSSRRMIHMYWFHVRCSSTSEIWEQSFIWLCLHIHHILKLFQFSGL